VLKETTNNGNPYENRYEDDCVPHWSNERADRGMRIKVRACRCRFMNCTLGDQTHHRAAL
jgi:hypothetical protein